MTFLKTLGKLLLVLLFAIAAFAWYYKNSIEPVYNGQLKLKGLSEQVTVFFDDIGVPHITANNQTDAYTALGYLHAQDRLWQMELIRRIAAGRLSEIFGADLIPTDKLFSGLGIEEASEKTIEKLDTTSEAYKLATAYLNGVNTYINNGKTPIEFTLVGVNKEPYTLKDMYNVFGYMAFSFAIAHKTDPLLTEVKEVLGDAYLNELVGANFKNLTLINSTENTTLSGAFTKEIDNLLNVLPIAPFIGSNAWVIGAEKTEKGKVIFANDPHIGYSQPSVWYQAHLKTPDYEMYGFHLALVPFPLLGHNKNYAYGLTMFENDDVDFYIEKQPAEQNDMYYHKGELLPYKTRIKRLKIKDQKDSVYTIKVSKHGPVMNSIINHLNDDRPIAMQWIYTKLDNKILDVAYEISHAKNLNDFKKGASKLHAPGLNMMYGDAKNNIAWFASGTLYKYRDSLYTKTYLDGSTGNDEILDYLDFSKNPQAVNPKEHYVYSANNQPSAIDGKLYPGYYLVEDRAKRIVNLLEQKNDWTKADVAKMMLDNTSPNAPIVVKNLLASLEVKTLSASEKKAITLLSKWQGNFDKTEVAPVIYNRFIYEFQKNTFKDEMGKAYAQFENTPLIEKVLITQTARDYSVWWDNVTTKNVTETKQDIVNTSFKNAFAFLSNMLGENVDAWQWQRVVSVEHKHAVGEVPALRRFFNVGPFVTAGGDQVINNQIYNIDSTGLYKVKAGPSTRRIIDFSDVENSLGIVPTGQSGRVFSAHYKDQAEAYLKGDFKPMKLNKIQIERSENKLILQPE